MSGVSGAALRRAVYGEAVAFVPFDDFIGVAPVAQETITRYRGAVESAVLEMWETHGYGIAAAGFIKIIDPDRYRTMVGAYLPRPQMIPLLATGMGDLVVAFDGMYRVLQYRYARVTGGIGSSLARFARRAADTHYLAEFLAYGPYAEVTKLHGSLTQVADFDDIYGYALPLPAGGTQSVENLTRVRIFEHIAMIEGFAGPIPFAGATSR